MLSSASLRGDDARLDLGGYDLARGKLADLSHAADMHYGM